MEPTKLLTVNICKYVRVIYKGIFMLVLYENIVVYVAYPLVNMESKQ